MHRYAREILYRPRCRNADRAWRLAGFSLVVCVLTGLLLRYGYLTFETAYPAFIAGLVVAVVAIVFALAAFVRIWRADDRGIGTALLGFIVAVAIVFAPFALRAYHFLKPGANDVSTDYRVLPPFSRNGTAFVARRGTIPETPAIGLLADQAAANPDIASAIVNSEPGQVFQQLKEIARDNGWAVVAAVPPGGRFGDGHVDMVLRTPALRLPVDMTIRIVPMVGGARVDIRCVSRYRYFDYSDNPAIVRGLLAELMNPPLG